MKEVFIVPTAIEDFATAREWPRTWYRDGKAWLTYPSPSNLRWLREAGVDIPADHDPTTLSEAQALAGV